MHIDLRIVEYTEQQLVENVLQMRQKSALFFTSTRHPIPNQEIIIDEKSIMLWNAEGLGANQVGEPCEKY